MTMTPRWIISSLPGKPSWVEELFFGGRRAGKTERLREQIKEAIDNGGNVTLSDSPSIDGQSEGEKK